MCLRQPSARPSWLDEKLAGTAKGRDSVGSEEAPQGPETWAGARASALPASAPSPAPRPGPSPSCGERPERLRRAACQCTARPSRNSGRLPMLAGEAARAFACPGRPGGPPARPVRQPHVATRHRLGRGPSPTPAGGRRIGADAGAQAAATSDSAPPPPSRHPTPLQASAPVRLAPRAGDAAAAGPGREEASSHGFRSEVSGDPPRTPRDPAILRSAAAS